MSHMNCLFVPSKGQSGGIAMIWTKETSLDIMTYSPHHIDAIVTKPETGLNGELPVFMDTWIRTKDMNHGSF